MRAWGSPSDRQARSAREGSNLLPARSASEGPSLALRAGVFEEIANPLIGHIMPTLLGTCPESRFMREGSVWTATPQGVRHGRRSSRAAPRRPARVGAVAEAVQRVQSGP